jgi:hypothetical protein
MTRRRYAVAVRRPIMAGGHPTKSWEDDFFPSGPSSLTTCVHELDDEEPYFTGLVTEAGEPIMAYPPGRLPIGFLWRDEDGNLRPKHEFFED